MKKRICYFMLSLLAVLLLAACGGGGSSSDSGASTGSLSVALTDATTDNYQAVYVTIDRVDVLFGDIDSDAANWHTVAEPATTYNLLELVNGIVADLGQDILATGTYGQMRLIIGDTAAGENNILGNSHPFANYVIDMDDVAHKLKVPSGPQTGIKLIHGFEIFPGQMTELILDFDASRSVAKAGNSGKYLLKPTIKILDVVNSANIFGTVTEENTDPAVPVTGAMVSAQTTDSAATTVEAEVNIEAGTVTTDAGEYALVVEPGTYNVVITASGYEVTCRPVSVLDAETSVLADFSLTPQTNPLGDVDIVMTLPEPEGEEDEPTADIFIRQDVNCGATLETVIVKSESTVTGTYGFSLPEGEYTIVVSSDGYATQTQPLTIDSTGTPSEDTVEFDFTVTP